MAQLISDYIYKALTVIDPSYHSKPVTFRIFAPEYVKKLSDEVRKLLSDPEIQVINTNQMITEYARIQTLKLPAVTYIAAKEKAALTEFRIIRRENSSSLREISSYMKPEFIARRIIYSHLLKHSNMVIIKRTGRERMAYNLFISNYNEISDTEWRYTASIYILGDDFSFNRQKYDFGFRFPWHRL